MPSDFEHLQETARLSSCYTRGLTALSQVSKNSILTILTAVKIHFQKNALAWKKSPNTANAALTLATPM